VVEHVVAGGEARGVHVRVAQVNVPGMDVFIIL
jgi:hypothetical protein